MNDMPFWVDFTASPRTILFVVCATLLAAGVGGVMPALRATRRDMAATLAARPRGASSTFGWASGLMVAVQVALSIALLNAALVMARGVAGYMTPALPVQAGEVLTARVWTESSTPDAVVDAIAAIPGVTAAGASTSLPGLSPAALMTAVQPSAGEPAMVARPAPVVAVRARFLETLGSTANAGRLFDPADFADNAAPVAIVNEPFVRKFLEGRNPIGRRLRTLPADRGHAGTLARDRRRRPGSRAQRGGRDDGGRLLRSDARGRSLPRDAADLWCRAALGATRGHVLRAE